MPLSSEIRQAPPVDGDIEDNAHPNTQSMEKGQQDVEDDAVWKQNPQYWRVSKKWYNMTILSAFTFLAPLASSIISPAVDLLMDEFGSTNEALGTLVVSVFVLGFAFGPTFLGPLSEIHGRRIIYLICALMLLVFNILCAVSSSIGMLIGMRFLAGVFGGCPLAVGGGTITDLFSTSERGFATGVYMMGSIIGPAYGPVIGGFLSEAKGWRWVFWLLTILSGAQLIVVFLFMDETYPPTLKFREARKLMKNGEAVNDANAVPPTTGNSIQILKIALSRPIKMLIKSPILLLLSLVVGVFYGYLYLLFTTFPTVFEDQYGFSVSISGLMYIGIGVGYMISLALFTFTSDRYVKRRMETGKYQPEDRLVHMLLGLAFIPMGLFWYGWSAEAKVFWLVPVIGTAFVGFGILLVMLPSIAYLVDVFSKNAASAVAANTIFRSIVGGVLPLAGNSMYARMGVGWGNSLLAFLAVGLGILTVVLYRFGPSVRQKYPYSD